MDMRQMVDTLNEWGRRYYLQDNPAVSDDEYDALYRRLREEEEKSGTVLPDSPTRRVGGAPVEGFTPYRHRARLWSMDKAQTAGELLLWQGRVNRLIADYNKTAAALLPAPVYTLEYKFDGLTVNLVYENGLLAAAATRGDGEVGEEITAQVKTIKSVPLSIPCKERLEVQGEGFMPLSGFAAYNETAAEPLKNPRNGAAGALRNLDPRITASRNLSLYAYNVGYKEGEPFKDAREMMAFLQEQGFLTNAFYQTYSSVEEILPVLAAAENARAALDFQIDGMVIKVADMETRAVLGYTDKFPRWAVAYKFFAEEARTRLLDVVWEVGRTGKVTPIAQLAPVDIGGATVRRATLNNRWDIERKNVALGIDVWVRRSNDVIPEIMGSVEGEAGTPVPVPTHCPACGTPLKEIGQLLFCENAADCRPQTVARLVHFASRACLDIATFSDKTAQAVVDKLGVQNPADLYAVTREQLLTLDNFKDKKADKLLAEMEKAKQCRLADFLHALGIPNVGKKTAQDLEAAFGSLQGAMQAGREQLLTVPEVGEIIADSVTGYFENARNLEIISRLLAAGFSPKAQEKGSALAGISFVLTGTLPGMDRAAAAALIEAKGGQVQSSVSKKTGYVVAGESAGSKLQKALDLGVPVLDEAGLLALLENA